MFRKLILTGLLLVVLPSLAAAQTGKLRGVVTDKETNDPLIGVNVVLEGTSLGAATDVNGEYVVVGVPPGVYSVRASYISYQSQVVSNVRVSAALTTTQDFSLTPSAIELEALEVVAERPLVQRNTTNTVRLTTTEDIENLPIRGLQNIVALNAGVVQQDGNLHIRGGRSGEVAYFIDGVNATNPLSNGEQITVIQEAIEEIQVQAGGFTAQFGGAQSGIVNTQVKTGGARFKATLDYRTDDFAKSGEEFLGTTSRGYRNAVATLSGPIGSKFRFFVAGQHNYSRNRDNVFIEPFSFGGAEGEEFYITDDGLEGRTEGEVLPMPIAFKKNFLPDNTYQENQIQGTLVYNMSNALKFRLTGSYTHSVYPNGKSSFTAALNNYFSQVESESQVDRTLIGLKATHLINPTTFYELNINYTGSSGETYDPFFGDEYTKYIDRREWAAAGRDTSGWVGTYQGPNPYSVILNFNMAPTNGPLNGYNKNSTDGLGGSLDFTSQLTSNFELKVGGRYDRYTYRNYGIGNISNYLRTLYPDEVNERTFESDYVKRIELTRAGGINNIGYDYLGQSKINDGVQGPRHPQFGSAYLQSKFEYRDLILNFGLRYEYIDMAEYRPVNIEDPERDSKNNWLVEESLTQTDPFNFVLPRVNFAFPVTDNTVFYAQYGKYVQMPSLNQIYQPIVSISNETLPETRSLYGFFGSTINFFAEPEKTNQYELGIRQTLTSDFAFTMTLYYKDLLDQLRVSPLLSDGVSSDLVEGTRYASGWTNEDFGTTKGIETTLELRRTKRLAARINYTLSNASGTGSNAASSRVAVSDGNLAVYPTLIYNLDHNQTHRGTVMLDYRFARGDGGAVLQGLGINALINFNSGHNFTRVAEPRNLGQANPWNVGTRATQDPRGRNPVEPVNASTTPWNFSIDLNVDKMFYLSKFNVRLYANVLNLLNTKNIINVYETTGTADDDGWLKSPLASQYVAIDGYEAFYRAINLQNGWGWQTATGTNLWSGPRQIRFGLSLEFF
ncbi:MAG: TonB-dependent receptor [Deferribacteres bacterium]|nr:TonB-dependent receptor [candidate division KSB1 bacterium]MCB9511508.1 TonB-dependent receptor [Deferribacteres bacterium]